MKASPGARSWIAAGVRHELLTRALPALRHDMAAPVSVIRMGLLLLKRQGGGAPQAEGGTAWEERVGAIESQLKEVVDAVRSLRHWELSSGGDDGITRSALVSECTGLMRAAFQLNGIGLQVAEGLVGNDPDEKRFAGGPALRYMVLGALGYLNDFAPEVVTITVEADGDEGIRFAAVLGDSEPEDPVTGALRAPRKLAIDAIALQSLAEDLGHSIEVHRAEVKLALPR